MKRRSYLFLAFLIKIVVVHSQIPESQRSLRVIRNTSPKVDTDFREKGLEPGSPIFLRLFKEENELELWVRNSGSFELFKLYPICYYSGELGPKTRQGDGQSPEGFYFIRPRQLNPWSDFHLSMNLGYPNQYERSHGYTGDYLMIHGSCVSIGCYAMTDEGIEEIYTIAVKAFRGGQEYFRVHIFPFRMTDSNMEKNKDHEWYAFWENLKSGYDWFEEKQAPPNVEVLNRKYVFN